MSTHVAPVGPKQHSIHAWQYEAVLLETHVLGAELTNSLPKHAHDEYQISYSLTDPSHYVFRRGKHYVPKGGVCVLSPGEVHSGSDLCVRPQASVFCSLYLPPAHLAHVAKQVAGRSTSLPHFPDPVLDDPLLTQAFLYLHRILGSSLAQLEQETHLLSALSRLVTQEGKLPSGPRLLSPSHRTLTHARDYLDAHCEEDVSLIALSQIAGLSEFHFCRAFGKAIGMPPHQYQTQARIHRAKRLLVTGLPLAQVATAVGFAQQSHFGWHFKRLVGITPGQYARHVGKPPVAGI